MIKAIIRRLSLPLKKYSRKLFFKKRFKEVSHLLEDGDYYLNLRGSLIMKVDAEATKKTIPNEFPYIRKMFAASDDNSYVGCVRHSGSKENGRDFRGSYILFSNKLKSEIQFGELKIFNLIERKVLSTFNGMNSFDKKLSNTVFFSKHFSVPKILESNEKELFLVEELIDFHKPKSEEFSLLATYILKSYQSYFIRSTKEVKTVSVQDFLNYHNLELNNRETLRFIRSHIDFVGLPETIPYIYQHGDLSLSNILIDDQKKIYFIDFEHASYFGFLYDVMWFWQNEAINNGDFSIIEYYFKGDLDAHLTEVFLACQLNYNSSRKLDYLLIVILEVIQKRVLHMSLESPNDFLNLKIKQAVDKIVQLSKFE